MQSNTVVDAEISTKLEKKITKKHYLNTVMLIFPL